MEKPNSSKKKQAAIAVILAAILLGAVMIAALFGGLPQPNARLRIVASFYPMYSAALRVAEGVDGVEVVNLTPAQTGCLHDYQTSPSDRITLSSAHVLVLNGAGAEPFLADAAQEYPTLTVVDTSQGVELLEGDHDHGHDHDHDDHDHHHHWNEHIWMAPSRYITQIENLGKGLAEADPEHADQYFANTANYIAEIQALQRELLDAAALLSTRHCILFHGSLVYLAEELGLEVLASLSVGEDSGVSAAHLAAASNAATAAGSVLLLYDNQYDMEYNAVAKNASYVRTLWLDAAVLERLDVPPADSWLNAMRSNLHQIKEAAE